MHLVMFRWKIDLKPIDIIYFQNHIYLVTNILIDEPKIPMYVGLMGSQSPDRHFSPVLEGLNQTPSKKSLGRPRCRREIIFRPKHHNHHYTSYERHFLVYRPEGQVPGADLGEILVTQIFFFHTKSHIDLFFSHFSYYMTRQ